MLHYYNEIDPYAADFLENLIFTGEIPDGVVDRRSIEEVTPGDLVGYVQCHFFAGLGGWPLALRYAGWPEDRPVWTGSCPCQPFSAAGKGDGFADERHLWPAWYWLIRQCGPAALLGEQVASKNVDPWIDLVLSDLEELDYACGAIAFPSASVGAPHIRDRTYWVGYAGRQGLQECECDRGILGGSFAAGAREAAERAGIRAVRLANSCGPGPQELGRHVAGQPSCAQGLAQVCTASGLGHANGEHARRFARASDSEERGAQLRSSGNMLSAPGSASRPGPTNGVWRAADWLGCRDDKWRPVEPGTVPLAHGVPGRVGRLRAYGNAINPWQAAEFIRAAEEARELML